MQTNSKILDDLAKVAQGAVGAAFTARDEVRSRLRAEFERVLDRMDLVTREEFEATRAMAAKARDEQEEMTGRIAALEARLAALEAPAQGKTQNKAKAKSGTRTQSAPRAKSTGRSKSSGAADKAETGATEAGARKPRTRRTKAQSSGEQPGERSDS